MADSITLQTYFAGLWHDAATVTFADAFAGHRSATALNYELLYCIEHDPKLEGSVRGAAALSVHHPLSMAWTKAAHWPAFLLDMLPQGTQEQSSPKS
jgi:serine/threonine-protein kinase HipA